MSQMSCLGERLSKFLIDNHCKTICGSVRSETLSTGVAIVCIFLQFFESSPSGSVGIKPAFCAVSKAPSVGPNTFTNTSKHMKHQ